MDTIIRTVFFSCRGVRFSRAISLYYDWTIGTFFILFPGRWCIKIACRASKIRTRKMASISSIETKYTVRISYSKQIRRCISHFDYRNIDWTRQFASPILYRLVLDSKTEFWRQVFQRFGCNTQWRLHLTYFKTSWSSTNNLFFSHQWTFQWHETDVSTSRVPIYYWATNRLDEFPIFAPYVWQQNLWTVLIFECIFFNFRSVLWSFETANITFDLEAYRGRFEKNNFVRFQFYYGKWN